MESVQPTRSTTDTIAVSLFGFGPNPDSREKRKTELRAEIQARQIELLSLEHEDIRCAFNSPSDRIQCTRVLSKNYDDEYRWFRSQQCDCDDRFYQSLDFQFTRDDTTVSIDIYCTNRNRDRSDGPLRYVTTIYSKRAPYRLPSINLITEVRGKWFGIPLDKFNDLQAEVLGHFDGDEEGQLAIACLKIIREKQDVFQLELDD